MSSVFGAEMENYQGDLNDIVRASAHHPSDNILPWQQPFPPADPLNFSSSSNAFGDPFSAIRDPLDLLHELNVIATGSGSSSTYFSSHNNSANHHHHMINMEDTSNFSAADNTTVGGGVLDDMTSPCSVFSRIQITQTSTPLSMPPPCDLPEMVASTAGGGGGHKGSAMFPSDMINVEGCLNIDNTGTGTGTASVPVQISSPRNLGIKRRKSQAKKVVCIPAPAAANSRSSGEVVPSDLWAWRKYGQKPIKGSPYPRGYYRCSSSKGCSARKQVERSRTDPNMLVITYTSEHNHPWPTQRNALAGSTRSQPSKSNATMGSKTGSPSHCQPQNDSTVNTSVKEEMEMEDDQLEAEFGDHQGIPHTFRPAIEDFFANLDEIETDPLNLLLQQGFNCDGDKEDDDQNKSMDPISSLFDWSGNNNI